MEVLEPLQRSQKEKADKLAAEEQERVRQAEMARQAALPVYVPQTYTQSYSGTLIAGSQGYISPINNCVAFVKQFRSVPMGNPISWQPATRTPYIGALVLFPYNHVGYLVGIYSDGSVAVAHGNAPGAPTRYTLGQLRGFL